MNVPPTFPRTTRALMEVLEAVGLRPRRGHGQNFLTDAQAVDAIVRDAGVTAADRVVEVGTGAGLLTYALCETGAEVVSFEVDEDILEVARGLREWPDRVRFVPADVLAGKHDLAPAFRAALEVRPPPPGRLLLVSNLPYGAGTPILLSVLALDPPPDEIVVMLQREVAEKLLAVEGTAEYGVTSVAVRLKATGRVIRRFGPEVFWPRPKVRSAVIRLVPLAHPPLRPEEHRPFGDFVTALFSHRRKVLATALRLAVPGLSPAEAGRLLGARGIAERGRVERIGPEGLLGLWREVQGRPPTDGSGPDGEGP